LKRNPGSAGRTTGDKLFAHDDHCERKNEMKLPTGATQMRCVQIGGWRVDDAAARQRRISRRYVGENGRLYCHIAMHMN